MAEFAVFAEFNTVGVVLLVFHGIVIPLLAFRARQGYLHPHLLILRLTKIQSFKQSSSKHQHYKVA